MENVLVTGAAGFIGFHLAKRLVSQSIRVIGLDNLNPYYDVNLKKARLDKLSIYDNFTFVPCSLEDRHSVEKIFEDNPFDIVVHLAAQAGVRYSIENPHSYVQSNIVAFLHILEGCRNQSIKHLVFASTSSVYGANEEMPYSVHQNVDHPVSLYAATKKSNELMAHAYSALYSIPTTGLRFFTVYGPWGRPDMAYFKFTRMILERKPIDVYNYGKMKRDFTYIDDIVEGVYKVMNKIPTKNDKWDRKNPDPGTSFAPFRIYNIGNNKPVRLMRFIEVIENELGIKAEKNLLPLQPGDVIETFADISDLQKDVGFKPSTNITEGMKMFISWYRDFYQV